MYGRGPPLPWCSPNPRDRLARQMDALRAFQQREMMMAPVDMTLKEWRIISNGLLGEVWLD